ncbi:MAG: hypothetical protein LR005_00545 [Candidatus Pacebacteria bacterium]|nr:hypothetical protein [Candidatus Paceibacterota bacterium]
MKEIISLISRNISETNKPLKAKKIIEILQTEPLEAFFLLKKLKREGFAVTLLTDYGFPGYIGDFLALETDKNFEERINSLFYDYPDVKGIMKSYQKVKSNFLKSCKTADVLYTTSLNNVYVQEKLKGLELALKVAPWGSIESIKIVRAIILINSGEILGKTKESLFLDEKNTKKQRAID